MQVYSAQDIADIIFQTDNVPANGVVQMEIKNTLNEQMKTLMKRNCSLTLTESEADFDVYVAVGPYFPMPDAIHIYGATINPGSPPPYDYPGTFSQRCYKAFQNNLMDKFMRNRTLLAAHCDVGSAHSSYESHI